MSDSYYVRIRGEVTGPYSADELKTQAARGRLSPVHSISSDRETWALAKTLEWLYPSLAIQPIASTVRAAGPAIPAQSVVPYGGSSATPASTIEASLAQEGPRSFLRYAALVGIPLIIVATVGILTFWFVRSGGLRGRDAAIVSSAVDESQLKESLVLVAPGFEVTAVNTGRVVYGLAATGSGFAVSADGYVVTNRHVIQPYLDLSRHESLKESVKRAHNLDCRERLWVFLLGEKYDAALVYASTEQDLAILKVPVVFKKYFELVDSSRASLDEEVRAIGFPLVGSPMSEEEMRTRVAKAQNLEENISRYFEKRDFEPVLTAGRVSRSIRDNAAGTDYIHHSASINHGNSGGPLLDLKGKVVGINTLGMDPAKASGFFFAAAMGQFRHDIERYVTQSKWVQP